MLNRRDFGLGVAAATLGITGCEATLQPNKITSITKYLYPNEVKWNYFMFKREGKFSRIYNMPGINPYSKYTVQGCYYSNSKIYFIHAISPNYPISYQNKIKILNLKYLEDVEFYTSEDLSIPVALEERIPWKVRFPNDVNEKYYMASIEWGIIT